MDKLRGQLRHVYANSPFYRRPVGLDSHPRELFSPASAEADLIVEWLTGSGM